MKFQSIQRLMGILLMLFSLTLLPPVAVGLGYGDGAVLPFVEAFLITLALGALAWYPVRQCHQELRTRDGFLVVSLFWVLLGIIGGLPFTLIDPPMSLTDAVFEAVSGLTTTGATVMSGLDALPHSILYYRMQLHWLGGMGIVVLAVAVLPMLGVGGMQLYRAETPGPMKDSKIMPRIADTAKALWLIYVGLTGACALAFLAAGMGPFDAITHAFSTLSTGGFSNYDASIAHFDSRSIELIAVFFMVLAGANFALHFSAWHHRRLWGYVRDAEFKVYLLSLSAFTLLIALHLYLNSPDHAEPLKALRVSLFQTVSFHTSTGFTIEDQGLWPGFAGIMLVFSAFIGGCASSTGGGIKVIRFLLLIKQGLREIELLIHPNATIPIRINDQVVEPRVMGAIWGFLALYVATFTVMYLAIAFTGVELMTAFTATAAAINNVGPGLAEVSYTCANLNDTAKWILSFAMLLGRLEIFTLLVLISPSFWRR